MKLTFLGSGASLHSTTRQHVNLLVETDKTDLIIDANGDTMRRLLSTGRDFTDLNHIFLTHRHVDHILGFIDLQFQNFVAKYNGFDNTPVLNVYGLEATLETAQELTAVLGHDTPTHFEFAYHPLPYEPGELTIGDLRCEYFPVDHGSTPCVGLRITDQQDNTLLFSADTAPCPTIDQFLQANDTLVHECYTHLAEARPGHTTFNQIIDLAQKNWPDNQVYLVHMSPELQAIEEKKKTELDSLFNGRVQFAHDMQVIEIS